MFYNGFFFLHVFLAKYINPICFVSFFPILGYRFSYLSFSSRHPLGPHFALEISFHYFKPCFLLEESFPLSFHCLLKKETQTSSFFHSSLFIFRASCDSFSFFVFLITSFLPRCFSSAPFIIFLYVFTTYFFFLQLTGLLNCHSIYDSSYSAVLSPSFLKTALLTPFGNALRQKRMSGPFHCFHSLLFKTKSLKLPTPFLN